MDLFSAIRNAHTLGELDKGRNNNLDLIRLLAAILVIYSHSYLVLGKYDLEPLLKLTGFIDFGALSVRIFFVISGFLITKSLFRQSSLPNFIRARFLRIFPALFMSVFLCAFIIGPFFTSNNINSYFFNTGFLRFILTTSTLHYIHNFLPGIFDYNIYPGKVNSPLWTLPAEVLMYILVFFVGVLLYLFQGKFQELKSNWLLILLVFLFAITMEFSMSYLKSSFLWVVCFLLGAMFYFFRSKIIINISFVVVLWLIFVVFFGLHLPGAKFSFLIALIYTVFVLGFHPSLRMPGVSKYGDFSYGLYIYAFPVQQLLAMKLSNIDVSTHFLWSFIITMPIAMASWYVVEKPALAFKRMKSV